MNVELIKLTKDIKLFLANGGSDLGTGAKLTTDEIQNIKANKAEIIAYLRKEKEEKQREKYASLIAELPPKKEVVNTPDERKFTELKKQADSIHFFNGPESDGLNAGAERERNRLMSEAQQFCDHNITEKIYYTLTNDVRRKVERTVECEKCELRFTDSVEEKLSEEAMWN